MTTFIESPRFPEDISYGSRGGPAWRTTVVESASGAEARNRHWAYPRHEYDVAYGVTSLERLEALLAFFHVVSGRAIGFRYKDWLDYKSCPAAQTPAATDCGIGTGDGAKRQFQLFKAYRAGSYSRSRKILKPVPGTVRVALNGVEQTSGADYTVDATTGVVTFTTAPAAGAAVTAGFEFDVPVRFDTDRLAINIEDYRTGAAQVPLIELKYGDS